MSGAVSGADGAAAILADRLKTAPPLNGRVLFDLGPAGFIHADGGKVTVGDADAETTLVMSLDTFHALAEGRQDPTIAFMQGKLKVRGRMDLALAVGALLEA